ncbi:MAG: serine/threonine protein kinase [Candidatus Eisenbacteria bacterium]|uniref:Serine/threonine protein kinase n=1 Tax=Eiseniibacteriota bacterium TaxID=2212470 RepID=A0A849SQA9_UNCEI|nr:serine/threonine protein kinase [Candidatus Eisenbacteria bacterium]
MTHLDDDAIHRLQRVLDAPDADESRYRVGARIGEGGMGVVYEAEDLHLGRQVALKVLSLERLSADAVERMTREARVLARLEHPGIVPVYDVGAMPDGRAYVAMKRVRGRLLDGITPGLSIRERLRLLLRVCEAVGFAHSAGVLHRDLKPANVMVGEYGEVLTLDWGVAKIRGASALGGEAREGEAREGEAREGGTRGGETRSEPSSGATRDGTIVGTPGYMSPEQARGEIEALDERSDVYGLGAILHFLLVGTPPRASTGLGAEAAALAAVPAPLRSIALRSLAPLPAARYESASAMAADLQRWLDGSRVLAHREGWIERLERVAAPHRTAIVLVLAYLAVRAVMLVVYGRSL